MGLDTQALATHFRMSMVCTRAWLCRLIVAGLLVTANTARADDHSDVNRLVNAGLWSDAIRRSDQFLASHPRDARMRFLKGLALTEQGQLTEAIALFTQLTEDFPELPEPYNNLAVVYSKQGRYEQARRSLEAAIRVHPGNATAYENLGDVYAKLASQAYSRAQQIDAGNAAVGLKLAMIRDLFASKASALQEAVSPRVPGR